MCNAESHLTLQTSEVKILKGLYISVLKGFNIFKTISTNDLKNKEICLKSKTLEHNCLLCHKAIIILSKAGTRAFVIYSILTIKKNSIFLKVLS